MVYYLRMTEKRKPTYDLTAFKAAFDDVDKLHVTGTAVRSAAAHRFWPRGNCGDDPDHAAAHFYESMTAYWDHRVWQDVYHVPRRRAMLYVKFTADAVTDFCCCRLRRKTMT